VTADERLAGAKLKAQWAELHIGNAEQVISKFLAPHPYKVGTKHDPQARQWRYYLVKAASPPAALSLIIGDALFNLRSALDHLAQQFYLLGTGSTTSARHVAFPIWGDATKYATESPRQVKGMRQDAIDFLNAAKPYKGGNDALWRLNELNNIDKHRLLITVGGAFGTLTMPAEMRADLGKTLGIDLSKQRIVGRMANTKCPLKTGDVLVTFAVDAEPDLNMEFGFDVSLLEPGILESQPIGVVLRELAHTVNSILDLARPLLA
jgi:hypothetical protein